MCRNYIAVALRRPALAPVVKGVAPIRTVRGAGSGLLTGDVDEVAARVVEHCGRHGPMSVGVRVKPRVAVTIGDFPEGRRAGTTGHRDGRHPRRSHVDLVARRRLRSRG
jgi:hypothetical protein